MCRYAVRQSVTRSVPAMIICLPSPQAPDVYLDPGTGSVLLQVGIATFVGGAFAVKIFWGRIRTLLGRLASRTARRDLAED